VRNADERCRAVAVMLGEDEAVVKGEEMLEYGG